MEQNDRHIPFRQTKLTMVLRDSFLAAHEESKIIMIACVSPGKSSADHTLNTLRYAERLKDRPSSSNVISRYMSRSGKETFKHDFYTNGDVEMDCEEDKISDQMDVDDENMLDDFEENMGEIDQEPFFDSQNSVDQQRKPLKSNFGNKPQLKKAFSHNDPGMVRPGTGSQRKQNKFGFQRKGQNTSSTNASPMMKQSQRDRSAKRSKASDEMDEAEFQEKLYLINEQHTECVRQDAQLLQSEGSLISDF